MTVGYRRISYNVIYLRIACEQAAKRSGEFTRSADRYRLAGNDTSIAVVLPKVSQSIPSIG